MTAEQIPKETNLVETMAEMRAHYLAQMLDLWRMMDSTMAQTTAEQIPRETNLVETTAEMRAHYSAQMLDW